MIPLSALIPGQTPCLSRLERAPQAPFKSSLDKPTPTLWERPSSYTTALEQEPPATELEQHVVTVYVMTILANSTHVAWTVPPRSQPTIPPPNSQPAIPPPRRQPAVPPPPSQPSVPPPRSQPQHQKIPAQWDTPKLLILEIAL